METRESLILVHKKSGLYYSKMADHTKDLWSARRWINEEQLSVWLDVSPYAPDPDEYRVETVDMTIERRKIHVQTE